ncbi:MAG: recombination protein RecR [Spirochaetales bacterium]|nr:recombination protein RecR [Spirochaetales bacterium]
MNTLESLIANLSRLPGIGRKSAARMAYFLLDSDKSFNESLADQIQYLKERIVSCSICGNYTEDDPCPICSDNRRDHSVICVVEQAQDVHPIMSTNEYQGVFHVLQGVLSPLDGVGPEDLTINKLMKRIKAGGIVELILATNPTVEGDTTALYLVNMLKGSGIKVSRLASGIPVGGDLEYADKLTLARSLRGRTEISLP